jgi:citrate lyase subunit beta / citryl-CoA lyase
MQAPGPNANDTQSLIMRSLLFVPADSEKKLAKASQCNADALVIDLEDSVVQQKKPAARAMAAAFLAEARSRAQRPRLYVRINALDTDYWEGDLAAIMGAQPDGILLPKPRSGEDVHRLSLTLHHAEERSGAETGSTRIITIATEMPLALLNMASFVAASKRLEGLSWGVEDLSAAIGARTAREADGRTFTSPFRLARDLTLFTAAAANIAAIDTVFANFQDIEGLRAEATAAARDGFTGKLAIHLDQVVPINEAFTPSPEEVSWAQRVVDLFAHNTETGVLSLDGQMIDRPHQLRAERILARAGLQGVGEA